MTAIDTASEGRQRYTAYYLSLLQKRLDWAIKYLKEHRQPTTIHAHMQVWLKILGECHRPELYSSAVVLISLLHPWPLHWGYWEDWEQELSFATSDANTIPTLQQKADLLTYLADMMFLTGRRDTSLKLGKLALSYARSANAIIPMARSGIKVAVILLESAETQAAADMLNFIDQAITEQEILGNLDYITARVYLVAYKARQLRLKDRCDDALVLLTDMIAQLDAARNIDPNILADCYSARSVIHWVQGASLLAINDIKQSIELVSLIGYDTEKNAFRSSLGMYYWTVGELKHAEETLRQCIRFAEQSNIYYWLIYNVGNLALVFLSQGRIRDALMMAERHMSLAKDHGSPAENMRALDNYGLIKFHVGDYQSARIALEKNVSTYEKQTMKVNIIIQLVNLSRCYKAMGEMDRAIDTAEKAFEYAENQSYPAAKMIALRCLAEVRAEQGKAFLRQALVLAHQCNKALDEAACLLSLSGLESNKNEQKKLWAEGMQILDKIGASAWAKGCSPKRPPQIHLIF